jgi:hypothetical protein
LSTKCLFAQLLGTLGIFWRNIIRLRVLHECLFGPDNLRFRCYDQKPLWFNACGGSKTLAIVGTRDVEVRDNVHATRMRLTSMSKTVDAKEGQSLAEAYALSGGTRDPRNLEIMFKAAGTGAQIREGLRREWNLPMDGCSLTFAPKGSYRVEHVVEFLEKDLGAADAPGDGSTAEVVLLDWYAAHLVKEVDDTIKGRGHVPMKLPGGSTAHISPPDTHAHRHQEREYRADEQWDALQQLRRGRFSLSAAAPPS